MVAAKEQATANLVILRIIVHIISFVGSIVLFLIQSSHSKLKKTYKK